MAWIFYGRHREKNLTEKETENAIELKKLCIIHLMVATEEAKWINIFNAYYYWRLKSIYQFEKRNPFYIDILVFGNRFVLGWTNFFSSNRSIYCFIVMTESFPGIKK